MVTVGPNLPSSTGTSSGSGGTINWSNAGNITVDDGTQATASLVGSRTTYYLEGYGFGFSIPTDATIDGMTFTPKRHKSGSGPAISDHRVRRRKSDGTVDTHDKAAGGNWPTSSTETTYGSSTDTWGGGLTPAELNDADSGFVLSCSTASGPLTSTANVDYFKCTVYYTEAGGASGVQTRFLQFF